MKKTLYIPIIFLITVLIGFSVITCEEDQTKKGSEPDPVENDILNGLWWCPALISAGGDGSAGTPGVWVFDYPNFWNLNHFGYANKGTYTLEGGIDKEGIASGTSTPTVTRMKNAGGGLGTGTYYVWQEVPPTTLDSRAWELKDGSNGKKELYIDGFMIAFVKAEWDFIGDPSSQYNGPWQAKIGDSELNTLIAKNLPPTPITDTAIDGLWWNEDLIKNGTDPGIWAIYYPDFWTLNSAGSANKGTFTISGDVSIDNSAVGSVIGTLTGTKTGASWINVSPPIAVPAVNITLSSDGRTLTVGATIFKKTSWYNATVNIAANNGPWQDKIDDLALTVKMPVRYGWNEATSIFTLPPFIDQPAAPAVIEYNNTSLTRDLFTNLVSGALETPARWGPADGNGAEARLINIRSNGIGTSRLSLRVLRAAQYLVFKLGPGFSGFNKEFCLQWYGNSIVRNGGGSTVWYYPLSPNITQGSSSFSAANGLNNGLYWDETKRLMIIEFAKAMPEYAVFAGANSGTLKIDDPEYDINSGGIIINLGFRANMGVFRDDWNVQNVYLVNIVD